MTSKRRWLLGAAVAAPALSLLVAALPAQATTYSDRGAAIVVWPKIVVEEDDDDGATDTLIQLFNVNQDSRVAAHCFYVNANYHCTNTGEVCDPGDLCPDTVGTGACVPGWIEIDFRVVLTGDQPLAWSADVGLAGTDTPCPQGGLFGLCNPAKPGGRQSNAGTRVPPVPERPFIGELKCIQVDPGNFDPINANDLAGNATIQRETDSEELDIGSETDVAKYNAIGLRTTGAGPNTDGALVIGGDAAEYEPCAQVLVVNHFFDFSDDPISLGTDAPLATRSELTLVPCTQDLAAQTLTAVTAQFLVYNEFEQRFSTSRQVRCLLDTQLSLIDTSQPLRSIFSAPVAGTIAGQTRITGVNGGLIGSALLNLRTAPVTEDGADDDDDDVSTAGYNIHQTADRSVADVISIP